MGNIEDMFKNYFDTYKTTSKFKDESRLEIALRKKELEKHLDDMWDIYHRNAAQIVEYNKQVNSIKEAGCKVMRNSAGKHKIITTN